MVLARAHLADEAAIASLNVETQYALTENGTLERMDVGDRSPTYPPDIRRLPLWRGVSVTAFGHVHGPMHAPFLRIVELGVGDHVERLVVQGPRVWQRRWGSEPEPSEPAPFQALALSWENAFGGEYQLPPGYLPGTELPFPGGGVAYPLNPRGVGFYADADAAVDRPLPTIEDPKALIRRWSDHPTPAGFAPCRDLPGLRMDPNLATELGSRSLQRVLTGALRGSFQLSHHAPAKLIFADVVLGTTMSVRNLGHAGTLRFHVPPAPIEVSVRSGRDRTRVTPMLRSIHVDADARKVVATYGHPFRYRPTAPPEWFEVTIGGQ